jgi:[ribosomal protein S18]-alanine N-acetyltransferase
MDDPCQIRPALGADAARLGPIERASFSDPWSEAAFREALATPIGFGFIAEEQGVLRGYLIGRLVAEEAEILNLAVDAAARRRGIGSALLDAALEYCAERGGAEVFLEVRHSNAAAQQLYLAAGFRVVGVRPSYYRRPTEDALVLRRAVPPPA